jgi:hypothetical protein
LRQGAEKIWWRRDGVEGGTPDLLDPATEESRVVDIKSEGADKPAEGNHVMNGQHQLVDGPHTER